MNMFAESGQPASLVFDLDACTAFSHDQSNYDYSEFTAEITNTSEISLEVVGGNLYRRNQQQNGHSCTPGINGTEAMCVTYDQGCNFFAESERAVRFDIQVASTGATPAVLQSISFFEKSPALFEWISGPSGPNNYPTKYGIRVMRDGLLIYEELDINTSLEWALQQFNFASDPNFIVEDSAVFSFQLQAYCPIGNGAMQMVWDVEQIQVTANCQGACNVNGGSLTGGPFEFCVGDGLADNIAPGSISLAGNSGTNSAWVVTDEQGNILGLPPMPSAVDFDGAGIGTCLIWHLSFENGLEGAAVGNNAADLQGCLVEIGAMLD